MTPWKSSLNISLPRLGRGGQGVFIGYLWLLAAGTSALAQNPPATPAAQPRESAVMPSLNRSLAAVSALAFSPDGKRLAVGTFGQVICFDTTTWQQSSVFRDVEDAVRSLAFSPDSQKIAIGDGMPGRTGRLLLWDSTSLHVARQCATQKDTVEAVCFRKDGSALLLGSNDNKARFISNLGVEKPDNSIVLDEHNGRVNAVTISPKPDFVYLTGGMDKIVKVWDAKTNKAVVNFDQSEGGITGLVALPNGNTFVGSSMDGRLFWWRVNYDEGKKIFSGNPIRTQQAHPDGVLALNISDDGKRLITSGADNVVSVWNAENGGRYREFKECPTPVYAVALSPDGKFAAGAGRDGMVRIWDVEAKLVTQVLVPPALPAPPKKAAAQPAGARPTRRRQ